METVTIVLVLLLAVVVSGAVARMLPFSLPVPLVQIALGAAVGLTAEFKVALEPELFLLVFLPPLLFLDGWRIPKDELLKDWNVVVELAFGLVLTTVLGMGLFIHWMIPAMPLAVAFALAAVVSPTDPIAVSSIAARVAVPKRMMHILEGESLLNDASGLVCLRFAVAAALTGSFSLAEASLNFAWLVAGGLSTGVAVTVAATRAKAWVSARFGEDAGSQILVSLLIPFGSYLLAEHFHASGILAAVAAGLTMTFADGSRQSMAVTRVRRGSVWDMIQFALNGIIFVLLGEQLPGILAGAAETVRTTGHAEPWWLAVYALAILFGLAALRFAWVFLSVQFMLLRRKGERRLPIRSGLRLMAATSLGGVRGAVTLAGVLTLPLTLADGTPFPARDLAVFLAASTIILSLAAASIGLPMLLKNLEMPPEPSRQAEETRARRAAYEAAIRAVERTQHALAEAEGDADVFAATGAQIMELYRARLASRAQLGDDAAEARRIDRIERELRIAGLQAERDAIVALVRARQVGSETAQKLIREVDLLEARFGW